MPELLSRLGFEPTRRQGMYLWYRSPLRSSETQASFKVNTQWNSWYDFGEGAGGNIIDFVMKGSPQNSGKIVRYGVPKGLTASRSDVGGTLNI